MINFKRTYVNLICLFLPSAKLRTKFKSSLEKVNNQKYDFVVSFGENCLSAILLNRTKLRKFSGPFDWVLGPDFAERTKLFCNGFEDYFNKEDLVFMGNYVQNQIKHDVYLNRKTGIKFLHDFQYEGDFEAEYPALKAKYERRIKRLQELVTNTGGQNKRFLVLFVEQKVPASPLSVEQIDKEIQQANEKFGGRMDVLYLRHNPELAFGQYRSLCEKKHLHMFELKTIKFEVPETPKKEKKEVFDLIRSLLQKVINAKD